jgi:hypothetical protein
METIGVLFFLVSIILLLVSIIWLLAATATGNKPSAKRALKMLAIGSVLMLASWTMCSYNLPL